MDSFKKRNTFRIDVSLLPEGLFIPQRRSSVGIAITPYSSVLWCAHAERLGGRNGTSSPVYRKKCNEHEENLRRCIGGCGEYSCPERLRLLK